MTNAHVTQNEMEKQKINYVGDIAKEDYRQWR